MNNQAQLNIWRDATSLSQENAERWVEDAKVLVNAGSFGHAVAALHLACQEMAKALVCWHVAEAIWPVENNKLVKDIFQGKHAHKLKNQLVVGMCWIIVQRAFNPRLTKGREPTGNEVKIAWTLLKDHSLGLEQARLKATYVDIRKETVVTPAAITENRARGLLKGVGVLVQKSRELIEQFPEAEKQRLRMFYASWPAEAWKSGVISIEQLRKSQQVHS
jgi:AbiV family abortive infection protein